MDLYKHDLASCYHERSIVRDPVGSKDWISIEEAAKRAGCSPEAMAEVADEGVLRKMTAGDVVLVRASDVAELTDLKGGVPMTAEDMKRRILVLERGMARLQRALDILYEANSMAASSLEGMDDDVLVTLYTNIESSLQSKEWPVQRIFSCCEVFLRISETEIERLNNLIGTRVAWKPFFELCLKQLDYVVSHPDLKADLDLQRCRDLLVRSRSALRGIAVTVTEIEGCQKTLHSLLTDVAATDVVAFDTAMRQLKS
jgi:hypothetical protein